MGRKDRMDHNFSKLQRLWRNQWRGDEIRMEPFPRIGYFAALRQSQKFSELFRTNTRKFHRKNSIDVASQPQGWVQGNTRIGPILEVTTIFHCGLRGIEIRIWFVGQDNSQFWVRICYGTNKYVIDSNHNNTEALADPLKNKRHKRVRPDQRQKQIYKRKKLLNYRALFQWTKENWLILSHQNHLFLCIRSLEESDQSSSTQSNNIAGRRWSNSIPQN